MEQRVRRLSPASLFMLSMNSIIGSGWLFAPLYAAKVAGAAAIISWIIGGFAAILIALTFAELSTMLPVAGGSAHIPKLSHGIFVSFILSWVSWITALMLAPIEVQAVLQYASLFFPSLMSAAHGSASLSLWGYTWATILMVMLCVLNIASYNGMVRFNFILFTFKISVMLLTIFMIMHTQFNPSNFNGLTSSMGSISGWQMILSAVATSGVVLAFNGFKNGVEMAGECKNLALAIPLSTAGAVTACLFIYLGLQICFIGAIDPQSLQSGWHELKFSGDIGPFVGLAAGLGLFWLLKLLYIDSIVSPLGAGFIYVASTARILYAMSRIGYMPKVLSRLNGQRFPVWAIVVNFILGMLSFLPLPGWQAMVNFMVSAMIITYAIGPLALMRLRIILPDQTRPFKLPAAHALCLLAFYFCNLFSYWTGWDTMFKLGVTLLIGFSIFLVAYIRGVVTLKSEELNSVCWMIPYLFGLVLISYLGSFGGHHIIPFGWDFLVIGIFSVVIFYLSLQKHVTLDKQVVDDFLLSESLALDKN